VAQDDNQIPAQVINRVLDAPQDVRGYHVAGDADHEDFPDALVEEDFRRHTRVRAG
jgi:hypothetical protein